MSVSLEEVYLVGCLLGRGLINRDTQGNCSLTFRIPFREYDAVGEQIVITLQRNPNGLRYRELLGLSTIRARNLQSISWKLGELRRWNPPTRVIPGNLITKVRQRWRIGDTSKVALYLERQRLLLSREVNAIKDFLLVHLNRYLSTMAIDMSYSERDIVFGITDHMITCNITQRLFHRLRRLYGLNIGEVFRHTRIPTTIFHLARPEQEEFIRGLADIVASFDKWMGYDFFRVQFSILDNRGLCIDLCRLLKNELKVPVHYIEWNEEYMDRGSRDILIKIFVTNFLNFSMPLFYNPRKQQEFIDNLRSTVRQIERWGAQPSIFRSCPRNPNIWKKYMHICSREGCNQLP